MAPVFLLISVGLFIFSVYAVWRALNMSHVAESGHIAGLMLAGGVLGTFVSLLMFAGIVGFAIGRGDITLARPALALFGEDRK